MASEMVIAAWLRFYARRETEHFGSAQRSYDERRAAVLAYVRTNCPEAADLIEGQASFVWFGHDMNERRAA